DCAPPPGALYGGMCPVGAGARRFIVWGDSHAGALRPTFDLAARNTHSAGYLLSANACAPLIGVEAKPVGRERNHCADYNRKVLEIIRRENIGTVFLVADWWTDAQPGYFRTGDLAGGLARTLQMLKGRRVYVV